MLTVVILLRLRPALLMWTVCALLTPLAGISGAQAANSQKKGETGKKKAMSGASLTGCLDQKEGHYILVDDRNLNPVADLEADGFPTEGFAKHMGHKVTVQGTSTATGTRPVFKVRSIETVSETCEPTPRADKK